MAAREDETGPAQRAREEGPGGGAAPGAAGAPVLPFLPAWLTKNVLIVVVVGTLLLVWMASGGGGGADVGGEEGEEGVEGFAAGQDPTVMDLVAAVNG